MESSKAWSRNGGGMAGGVQLRRSHRGDQKEPWLTIKWIHAWRGDGFSREGDAISVRTSYMTFGA